MKVAISTLGQCLAAPTGLTSLFNLYARTMPPLDPQSEFHFIVSEQMRDVIGEGAPNAIMEVFGWDDSNPALRLISEHVLLGPWLARSGFDVLLMCNAGTAPLLLPRSVGLVQAVLGLQHFNGNEISVARRIYRRSLFRYSMKRADRIVANARFTLEYLQKIDWIDRSKLTLVPHGIDERQFHDGPISGEEVALLDGTGISMPFVLFVSKIYRFKNLHTAIEGWCRFVKRTAAPHKFLVIGHFAENFGTGEDYRRQILQLVDRYGLSDRLVIAENVPLPLLRAAYRRADVYIQPSPSETFGRTTVESMACGCPVVAANGGATPEIMGDAGLYFEPTDIDGCATQIARLVEDPTQRQKLVAAGLERARQYSIASESRLLIDAMKQADEDRRRRLNSRGEPDGTTDRGH